MPKALYICSRTSASTEANRLRLLSICNHLVPDNVKAPMQHFVHAVGKNSFAIMNRRALFQQKGASLLLGHAFGGDDDWTVPGSRLPDGSYALFRDDVQLLEVASDPAASRTIWYYSDGTQFVASTSQRMLIMYLGNFEFDECTIPWMLSSGSLGPALSWDKRLRRLPPASTIVLDKISWRTHINTESFKFTESSRSRAERRRALKQAICDAIRSLETHKNGRWVLPLSGGYDSRGLLLSIMERPDLSKRFKTITWGLSQSVDDSGSDSMIAEQLSREVGVEHTFCPTDTSGEPAANVIDRFILCGEGRVDHLAGYMDGLELWRHLSEEPATLALIRGDEGFGWSSVTTPLTCRLSVGCGLCEDFANLKTLARRYAIPPQSMPKDLEKGPSESLSQYRDRLYHTFRIPTVLAALSDIKFSYIDQITPLLSRTVVDQVKNTPDRLRTDKVLFKEVVNSYGIGTPYARSGAIDRSEHILRSPDIVDLLADTLSSRHAKALIGTGLCENLVSGLRRSSSRAPQFQGDIGWLKRILPRRLKDWTKAHLVALKVDPNVLAFRAFIIVRMHALLSEEANVERSRIRDAC